MTIAATVKLKVYRVQDCLRNKNRFLVLDITMHFCLQFLLQMSSKHGPILPEENSYMVRDAFYSFNVNVIFDKKQVMSLIKNPSSNVVPGKVLVAYSSRDLWHYYGQALMLIKLILVQLFFLTAVFLFCRQTRVYLKA